MKTHLGRGVDSRSQATSEVSPGHLVQQAGDRVTGGAASKRRGAERTGGTLEPNAPLHLLFGDNSPQALEHLPAPGSAIAE